MAVFERKKEDRIATDDSKPLVCNITGTENTDGHVVRVGVQGVQCSRKY